MINYLLAGNVLVAVLMVLAKLLGAVSWSWVWVLAPLWMGAIGWLGLLCMVIWALARNGY